MDYLEFRIYKVISGRFYNLFFALVHKWDNCLKTIFLLVKEFINFPEPNTSPTNNLMEYYHCQWIYKCFHVVFFLLFKICTIRIII